MEAFMILKVLIIFSGALAWWTVQAAEPLEIHAQASQQSPDEVKAYWTTERLRNATPFPMPVITQQEHEEILKGRVPNKRESKRIRSSEPRFSAPKSSEPSSSEPSQVNPADWPYRQGGKLHFTDPATNRDYTCTAQFVGSVNIVMTAAHCVYNADGGYWYKNHVFKRGYDNGGGQKVNLTCMRIYAEYTTGNKETRHKYDYAFLYTHEASGASYYGLLTDTNYDSWRSIGYPSNYGHAKYMYSVVGTKGKVGKGVVEMLGNPMGHGSSGGAWLVFIPGASNEYYAIGLNSYQDDRQPENTFGPYFDNDTYQLYSRSESKGPCPSS